MILLNQVTGELIEVELQVDRVAHPYEMPQFVYKHNGEAVKLADWTLLDPVILEEDEFSKIQSHYLTLN